MVGVPLEHHRAARILPPRVCEFLLRCDGLMLDVFFEGLENRKRNRCKISAKYNNTIKPISVIATLSVCIEQTKVIGTVIYANLVTFKPCPISLFRKEWSFCDDIMNLGKVSGRICSCSSNTE